MNLIKSILRNLFEKETKAKALEGPKKIEVRQEKEKFIKSLKTNEIEKQHRKKIITPICIGDGLGIQKKISS